MKIYLEPNPGKRPDRIDGGIRRVIDAQIKYLPKFGIRVTHKIENADLTAGHVDHAPIVQGKPFVSHCHGLLWSEYFDGANDREVNQNVVNAMLQADAITVPSNWVAHALSYGMLRTPQIIYHGVDIDEWQVSLNPGNYVLWNKARADAVSNPQDLMTLAKKMPQAQFVSTLGNPSKNLRICGTMNYPQMKSLIQNAGVYLATARETFGIGTLEALACGVPVAGWDYGGQSEIILQGETGYLAPYGDYNALEYCINKCFSERARLSTNARADVEKRWQWIGKIEQYANLYKATLENWTKARPKVSVIVPCHNLAKYLPDALNSLLRQTMTDWECIIVDDASMDNSAEVANEFIKFNKRFKCFSIMDNLKLSLALDFGHLKSTGKYTINLDADNILPENALEILSDALDKRRDLHIVYGALDTMSDDGTNRQHNQFPYPVYENYSWFSQMAHLNQLHSGAMMRREVIEQSAGYRERQWRAEDAELWARVSSFGFRIERVTDQPTLIYRWRQGSKSQIEYQQNADKDGDWLEYFPWRTAKNAEDGKKQIASNSQAIMNPQLVPFGAQGKRTDKLFWDVSHRQEPLVSVIIPVGPGHGRYLPDALDSLIGQTMNEWEAVVINDTGEMWSTVPGAPYAKVFSTTGKCGAGAARNLGLQKAISNLVIFLDADDMLKPNALVKMTQRYARGDTGYIYCDAEVPESPTKNRVHEAGEFTQAFWLKNWLHSTTILMNRQDAIRIGFDESLTAHEDLDFFIRCAIDGLCGARIPEPLLLYRKHLGQRSAFGFDHKQELFQILQSKYQDYRTGAKKMAGCKGCGDKKVLNAIAQSHVMQTKVESMDKPLAQGFVRIKYTGAKMAPVSYYANGHGYPFCATSKYKIQDIPAQDAEVLLAMAHFERVRIAAQIELSKLVEIIKPVEVATPESVKIELPKPVAPKVDPVAMQKAVALMEQATGEKVQPTTVGYVQTAETFKRIESNDTGQIDDVIDEHKPIESKKRGYKGKRK